MVTVLSGAAASAGACRTATIAGRTPGGSCPAGRLPVSSARPAGPASARPPTHGRHVWGRSASGPSELAVVSKSKLAPGAAQGTGIGGHNCGHNPPPIMALAREPDTTVEELTRWKDYRIPPD